MRTSILLYFLLLSISYCYQKTSGQKPSNMTNSLRVKNDMFEQKKVAFDTTKIVILPLDTSYYQFNASKATVLSEKDLKLTESILIKCIDNNNNQGSNRHVFEYIDLGKYKRQYMPFQNKRGEKVVWVNCFCISNMDFPDWKKAIVIVDDGGSCFFNVIINLTTKKYEHLFINGYG